MTIRQKTLSLVIGLLLVSYWGIASATLLGKQVLVARQYGTNLNALTTIESWTVTVSTSLELDNIYGDNFDIDLGASSINILFNRNLGAGTGLGFNGLTFADSTGTINAFTSFSLSGTTVAGFTSSFLSFQENKLFVDLTGLMESTGQYINLTIGFTESPVPEPMSMLLLGLGVVGFLVGHRK